MEKKPFIHQFKTSIGNYIYDVNTDKILKVPKIVYDKLSGRENIEDENEALHYIDELKKQGFLKPNKKRITEHPETKYLPFHLKSNLSSLLLQVTQDCNFRCNYCIYSDSGKYINRKHSKEKMSFETAKKGIDFVIKHSKDSDCLHFGFYGGEPLLEIDLIEKSLKYITKASEGRAVYFNLTTNGTLLTPKIAELFEKYKVNLLISLDGPEHVHDKERIFAANGGGTHKVVIKNITMIRNKFPEYFKHHVQFNTVLNGEDDFKCIDEYFIKNELFYGMNFLSTLVTSNYATKKNHVSENFISDKQYSIFISILAQLGKVDINKSTKLLATEGYELGDLREEKAYGGRSELPVKSHHNGPCIPGEQKLFLNTKGELFPCEKVSELSEIGKIGTLETGFNLERANQLLNIEKITEVECHKCWAYDYCTVCIACADNLQEVSKELIEKNCPQIRLAIENKFKDYCVLKELGCDFYDRNQKLLFLKEDQDGESVNLSI